MTYLREHVEIIFDMSTLILYIIYFISDENGLPVTCMRATLSYDRAGVDDDTAAAFLEELKNILENPTSMMLGGYKSQVDHPLAALL